MHLLLTHPVARRPSAIRAASLALLVACVALPPAPACAQAFSASPAAQASPDLPEQGSQQPTVDPVGPVRLAQPVTPSQPAMRTTGRGEPALTDMPPEVPSEFERYVQSQVSAAEGAEIHRFGYELVTDAARTSAIQDPLPVVPANYVISPGDEVTLSIWGSVDANLRLVVDRSGQITIPRVGAVHVAGLRYDELSDAITRRVGQVFRNFQLSASLGQLRAIRVFVAGFARRPGSTTVSSLSSVLHVLMRAGGPSSSGSFRDIHLRRGNREIATFDLYDLLLKGDRNADQLVQPDDVVFIGPVGPQVALVGSVNQPAIFELKPGETMQDLIRMAGGFSAVADRSRVTIERLADRVSGRVADVSLPQGLSLQPGTGDLVRAFSAVSVALPQERQNKRIRVEGEVLHPGDYVLPPGSTLLDAVRAAGGLTQASYLFGTEFQRESVRRTQQQNYDRALRDLETDMAKDQASRRTTTIEEANAQANSGVANAKLLDRLRQVRPTGRIVLQIDPKAPVLPDLPLEDADTLMIPGRPTSVGVFGSVFNAGSFVFAAGQSTEDYLRQAGGPTRGADRKSIFMIRANGSVVSALQSGSFWSAGNTFATTEILPGDTLFVPEELDKSTFTQNAKDWTQILYQFGLGLAGIKTLGL